jgi:hypothetical protein
MRGPGKKTIRRAPSGDGLISDPHRNRLRQCALPTRGLYEIPV